MKFTDGNWLVREEYKIFGATEVNDYEISDNSVILYVPTFHVNSRGDTLGGPLLTVEISSPMEDVISVKLYHFKGKTRKSPKFERSCQVFLGFFEKRPHYHSKDKHQ
ncbi:hypothetical protein [Thermoanaerobacterium thermosaccharolyticum]|uniref:hypothetical protein n=1 Tax=Thermoanaerobacterium thermosaccharolyticum TaxID=1517 RepID=UPI0020A3FBDD|nr:hypothetical protein [Thermoanaerobacterium thermosaccharolyticum]MCP2241270.1 hypothetical protein [Thermoanaerobacterium thermosaccharolyticum]